MKRILICSTILTTIKAFLIPHIQLLREMGYIVDVAGQKDVEDLDNLVNAVYDLPFQRNPFSKLNLLASRQLKEIVQRNNYDIIHFHTPVASAFGRCVVRQFRKDGLKVLYTAHGFHFYKGAPLLNWLLYYPVERFLARYTDTLITINQEDYNRARRFKAKKAVYIPGVGLNIGKFSDITIDKRAKCNELGIPQDSIILLSVGELNKNKNHETVIKAIANLKIPNLYYLICGEGDQRPYLERLISVLGLEDKVKIPGFRTDVSELYKIANIFVFPSYREGLSVALMEAMASGLPVVCSKIRGNIDLINEQKGGFLLNPKDVNGFSQALSKLINDDNLCFTMGVNNKKVVNQFGSKHVLKEMSKLYSDLDDNN